MSVPKKEVILLNDLKYERDGDRKVMAWHQFLNLLDGSPDQVAMPKSFRASDIEWTAKQPIFASASKEIAKITADGHLYKDETYQKAERWVIFKLYHKFVKPDYSLIPCGHFFAELILEDSDQLAAVNKE